MDQAGDDWGWYAGLTQCDGGGSFRFSSILAASLLNLSPHASGLFYHRLKSGPNVAETQLRPFRIQGDLKTLPTGSLHFKRFGVGREVLLGSFWWKRVPVK